jgi:hypothetical protein
MTLTSIAKTKLPAVLNADFFDAKTSVRLGFQKNLKQKYLDFLGLTDYANRLPSRMLSGASREVDHLVYKYISQKLRDRPLSAFEFAGGTSLCLPNTSRNYGSFFLSRLLVHNFANHGLSIQASDLASQKIEIAPEAAQVLAVSEKTRTVLQLELNWQILDLTEKLASQYGMREQLLSGQVVDLNHIPRSDRRTGFYGVLACIQLRPWVDRAFEKNVFGLDVLGDINATNKLPSNYDVIFCRHTLVTKDFEVDKVCKSAQDSLNAGGRAFLNFDTNKGLIILELGKTKILKRHML